MVVAAAREPLRQAVHLGHALGLVVSVCVALAVPEVLHQAGRRVPDPEGHRLRARGQRVLHGLPVGPVDGVALGRRREVDHELGEGQRPFGHPDEVHGLLRGHGQDEGLGVGQAHVLGGEAHQAARDVERVLAGLQHARQPVEAGVGVGVADRLVERADDVEVLLARAVVEEGLAREGLLHGREVDAAAALRGERGGGDRQLEDVQGGARVAVRGPRQEDDGLVVHLGRQRAEAALGVAEGVAQHLGELRLRRGASGPPPASARAAPSSPRTRGSRWWRR